MTLISKDDDWLAVSCFELFLGLFFVAPSVRPQLSPLANADCAVR